MPDGRFVLLAFVIAIALTFDYTNGFHDTANAIATSVSTRALSPRIAVLLSAALNLAGAFFNTKVADTIGGLVNERITLVAILSGLVGAIAWNLLTWYYGLPSSSSHALIGGLVGAALAQSGSTGVQWHGIAHKVVIPALVAPAIAFGAGFVLLLILYWLFKWMTPGGGNRTFRLGQLASSAWVSFNHGANDAQKTMGVIALALVLHSGGDPAHLSVPTWVKIAAGLAMAFGTYAGGWRIIRTLGQRIFKMEPVEGFAAQTAAGATIYLATRYGYPLSTTHVVSGAVMGTGATKRVSAVRWGVAGNIVAAWVLTLPMAALAAAALYWPVQWIF